MGRNHDLLTEIESGALDSSSDLPALLRKCIALGGVTGSERLRDWAALELKGYKSKDDLPKYREVHAPLLLDGVAGNQRVTGQMVPGNMVPDYARDAINTEVSFLQPIAEVAAMLMRAADSGDHFVRLSPPGSTELVVLINDEFAQHDRRQFGTGLPPTQIIERIYWSVSEVALTRILDVVRTTLVELVAEMRAGTPKGQGLPSREVADQAVEIAIYGRGNRIVVNQVGPSAQGAATSGGVASVGNAEPETSARKVGWWVFGVCGAIGAGAGVWALFVR